MEDVNVPSPNPFITQWLLGAECRSAVYQAGELAEALYRQIAAKRSGRMVASTHISTGIESGRWVSHMAVTVPYAAAQIFGAGNHPGSTHTHFQRASRDLNQVLDMMGKL
ncbi:hypothetical protein [Nocardia spumae]|uniref:hypothetical protein n=1 Tax=Nocardia spumae TaxID=2887190 RepID=UPI001D15BA06|nr:hypothetical protein [Nocardia spumae]